MATTLQILRESDAGEAAADEKGVVAIVPPLPPGCMTTVWGDDERFVNTYFTSFRSKQVYSTFDWGIRDKDGYHYILGRTDDVINVAGHRLGTREIEEAVQSHANVAEVAVVGVADSIKGQMPLAFVVVKDSCKNRHARTQSRARKRSDGGRGQTTRRHRPSIARAFRDAAAQNAIRKIIAALDPGAGRRARCRRSHHH